MTFKQWWSKHGKDFWGAPVSASQAAWNAALESVKVESDKRNVLDVLDVYLIVEALKIKG
jgi:hypothetical protein